MNDDISGTGVLSVRGQTANPPRLVSAGNAINLTGTRGLYINQAGETEPVIFSGVIDNVGNTEFRGFIKLEDCTFNNRGDLTLWANTTVGIQAGTGENVLSPGP